MIQYVRARRQARPLTSAEPAIEDDDFHPYTSKFDLYVGNKIGGELTPAEQHGARIFTDPDKGNCC